MIRRGVDVTEIDERQRLRDDLAACTQRLASVERRFEAVIKAVIPLGVAMLGETDFGRMLESLLVAAKDLCNADGGTLYLCEDKRLRFAIVRNDSLGIALGGSTGEPVPFDPLSLQDPISREPNRKNVATYTALTGITVNIPDAYAAQGFDFSGTRAVDTQTGYRSISFLTVPLKNATGRVIGVLQLLNAREPASGAVVAFDPDVQPLIESLGSLAAAALEAYLREEHLRRQIAELQIQVDQSKKVRQVAEIADTDYFRDLQQRARELRRR